MLINLNIRKRSNKVSKTIRIMTYKDIVESVLLFNCSTWALSIKEADNLDTYQRRQLRKILGHVWSDKVSNEDLYKEAGVVPASLQVLDARWRLFGHILRMNENTPARKPWYIISRVIRRVEKDHVLLLLLVYLMNIISCMVKNLIV